MMPNKLTYGGTDYLVIIFLCFLSACSPAFASCDYLPRVNNIYSVSPIHSNSFEQNVLFSSSNDESIGKVGNTLSGENLYLYSNGTYIYTEWADILLETIFDKGAWHFSQGCIFLKSDADIKWKTDNPKTLVAFRRSKVADEIFLLGVDRDLSYFEENSEDEPEFMLLLTALKRIESDESENRMKQSELMSRSWNPGFFE